MSSTSPPDLSVVIPMRNSSATIERVVMSFLDLPFLRVEIVVVDDASTDGSGSYVARLGRSEVQLHRFDTNRGPGEARNWGFQRATGRYTLFFDADDEIHADALRDAVVALDDSGADVAFLPYRYRRGNRSASGVMNDFDLDVWRQYAPLGRSPQTLNDVPKLLGFTNYPWNKVIRTEVHRRSGLRFATAPVHEDILGHWLLLLDSTSIVLVDRPLCTHIVTEGGRNQTHRDSGARLRLIDVLDETYSELERRPVQRRQYAPYYWDFALRIIGWTRARLASEFLDEFDLRWRGHLLRVDLGDFVRLRSARDPELANRILQRALR